MSHVFWSSGSLVDPQMVIVIIQMNSVEPEL